MPHSSPKFILEQIYNFVIEMPDINSKSQFMQLSIFFIELHESKEELYEAVKPYTYKVVINGVFRKIEGNLAPNFLNKREFIEWVAKKLGE